MAHKIMLSRVSYGYFVVEVRKGGRDIFVQSDWDYPGLARSFGWRMRGSHCRHDETDGTITCPKCGKPASYFIKKAVAYLDAHDGKVILDPGYFAE